MKQSEQKYISKLEEIHFWRECAQTGAYGESLGSLVHQAETLWLPQVLNQGLTRQRDRGDHNQIAQTLRRPTCINFSYSWNLTFSHLAFIFS